MESAARKRRSAAPRFNKRRSVKPPDEMVIPWARESIGIFLVALGVFLAFALFSYARMQQITLSAASLSPLDGNNESILVSDPTVPENSMGKVGAVVAEVLMSLLGWCSFVFVLWAFLLARRVWVGALPPESRSFFGTLGVLLGSVSMVSAAATFVTVLIGHNGGGKVGAKLAYALVEYVNEPGALLVSFVVFVVSLGLSTGIGTTKLLIMFRFIGKGIKALIIDAWFLMKEAGRVVSRVSLWMVQNMLLGLLALSKRIGGIGVGPVRMLLTRVRGVSLELAGEDVRYVQDHVKPKRQRREQAAVDGMLARGSEKTHREKQAIDVDEDEEFPEFSEDDREIKVSRHQLPHVKKRHARLTRHMLKLRKKRTGHGEVPATNSGKKEECYESPPLDLLVAGEVSVVRGPQDDELIRNSRKLEKTLNDFRIGGKITEVQPGPIITLYHFEPAAGMKVQKVVALADDIALALKVASVRVYAPVPGKGTVGIEVPNSEREVVRLRDLLASNEFQNAESPLTLAVGKDTFGEPYVGDLSRMPHLLIAGATGTGKSVCINAIILSLLYRNDPSSLRLILIDPKMLELSVYEHIPHLKAPVVTNPKRARSVLWWAVEEMDRRYELMKAIGVRNLASYNRAVTSGEARDKVTGGGGNRQDKVIELAEEDIVATGSLNEVANGSARDQVILPQLELSGLEQPLPRIVIVVDELADLMLTVGREIEELLTRLAQKARASGIHLILATQRPSVNVITGLIKANFPSRISFQVASRIDARTVLDVSGADKLLGHGDMLFLAPGAGRVKRLHGAFVSDKEVHDVVEWIKRQGPPDYDRDIETMIKRLEEQEQGGGSGLEYESEYDPLYDQATRLVVEKGLASTSMIQRAFRIGYNRAARILETMEREGLVGPPDGAKPRAVLIPNREEFG